MTKTNEATLNKAINAVVSRLEKTEAFVVEQAPDICKEMIKEGIFDCLTDIFVQTGLFLATLAADVFLSHYADASGRDTSILSWGSIFIMLITQLITLSNLVETVQKYWFIKNCPKLFLLRSFKRLVR